MSLVERSRRDMQSITSKMSDFAVPAIFTDLSSEVAEVNVIHTKHNLGYTPEGVEMNVRTSSIAVSNTKVLEANADYSFLNAKSDVTYLGHSVTVPDSNGIQRNYIVSENYPDENLGLTVLILGQKD